MTESIQAMIGELSGAGLNHWGVVSAGEYDSVARPGVCTGDLFPEARSIVVFASGGRTLWDAFTADLSSNPHHLVHEQHPLDAFVVRAADRASKTLSGVPHRWFFASAESDIHLDFRTLAVRAGIGVPSRLGLVIDQEYGPWLGLRAACMVPVALPETRAQSDLCDGCASPCISACPGSALEGGRWSVDVCASFHRASDTCSTRCDARSACPVGQSHRYTEAQARYHYNREIGRAELSQALGIEDEIYKGLGPSWAEWSG